MAILSAMLNLVSCFHPEVLEVHAEGPAFDRTVALLLSKVRAIAAFSYRMATGKPIMHPTPNLSYCSNFLHMMFSQPYRQYVCDDAVRDALDPKMKRS